MNIRRTFLTSSLAVLLFLFACASSSAQTVADDFLGVKLPPELETIVKEIERKTGAEIYAEFVRLDDYQLGSSFVSDDGTAVVLIDQSLEDDVKKLKAVIAHELLHLRLRVNNYPSFIFSPTVQTAKGRAIDTEQSNVNDLRNLIEHRVFKSEMEQFGLYKIIDLAGDTLKNALRSKGAEDGQSDSINYARAVLEYLNAADVEAVKRAYEANKWTRSLAEGQEIANLISSANPKTPQAVEAVFLKCLPKLYPIPAGYTFTLKIDAQNNFFRQMIIGTACTAPQKKRAKR